MEDIENDDAKIRETFNQVRRKIFELEKEKYRRLQDAAEKRLGISKSNGGAAAASGDEVNEANRYSVFTNWKRVLLFAVFFLILQWGRIVNIYRDLRELMYPSEAGSQPQCASTSANVATSAAAGTAASAGGGGDISTTGA